MNHVELFGKIDKKTYLIKDTEGTLDEVEYDGERIVRHWIHSRAYWNKPPIMPTITESERFFRFEKFHEYDSDSFEVNKGEFILEERMKIEAEVEKVVRKTNGDIRCYLDFVYRTEESPEAEKYAKEFFEKEKAKYEIEIGPERDKVIDGILNELNNLGSSKNSEDSVVKKKKWYEFWKTQ